MSVFGAFNRRVYEFSLLILCLVLSVTRSSAQDAEVSGSHKHGVRIEFLNFKTGFAYKTFDFKNLRELSIWLAGRQNDEPVQFSLRVVISSGRHWIDAPVRLDASRSSLLSAARRISLIGLSGAEISAGESQFSNVGRSWSSSALTDMAGKRELLLVGAPLSIDEFRRGHFGQDHSNVVVHQRGVRIKSAVTPSEGYYLAKILAVSGDYFEFEWEEGVDSAITSNEKVFVGGYLRFPWSYSQFIAQKQGKVWRGEWRSGRYVPQAGSLVRLHVIGVSNTNVGAVLKLHFAGNGLLQQFIGYGSDSDAVDTAIPIGGHSFRVSRLRNIVEAHGVSGLIIEGLTLSGATGNGLLIEESNDVLVKNVVARGFGGSAIRVIKSTKVNIVSSIFGKTGGTAVWIQGGDIFGFSSADSSVIDSLIEDFAEEDKTYRAGITLEGRGFMVKGNTIRNGPHMAVHIKAADVVIENNIISDVCKETADAGGIYLGRNVLLRGIVIRGNKFSRILNDVPGGFVASVYLDDGVSGVVVDGNTFQDFDVGVAVHGGSDNVLSRNTFVRGKRFAVWAGELPKALREVIASQWLQVESSHIEWARRYPELLDSVGSNISVGKRNFLFGNSYNETVDIGLKKGAVLRDDFFRQ